MDREERRCRFTDVETSATGSVGVGGAVILLVLGIDTRAPLSVIERGLVALVAGIGEGKDPFRAAVCKPLPWGRLLVDTSQ